MTSMFSPKKTMTSMLNQIQKWLMQPVIRGFVCYASLVVGLLCFGLSSSFNHLFGKWEWWKILVYCVFCCIICLFVWFGRKEESLTSRRVVKAHLVFLFLIISTGFSIFFDGAKVKPDAFNLISFAAFSIMSLTLSKQTHCGIEVDLLHFFCVYLTIQLAKINPFLFIVGAGFTYFLNTLRFYLSDPIENAHLGFQLRDRRFLAIQIQSNSGETNTGAAGAIQLGAPRANTATANALNMAPEANSDRAPTMTDVALPENGDVGLQDLMVTQVDSHSQQGNSDSDRTRLNDHTKKLSNINRKLNSMIWDHVEKYQEAFALSRSLNNFWAPIDKILGMEEINKDLAETVKYMVEAGFGTECCNVYNTLRSKFVNKCLRIFGLQEVNLGNVEEENIESLIAAFKVALRILLPDERRLWRRVFSDFPPKYNVFSTSDWRRMELELWAKFMVLESRISSNIAPVTVRGKGIHPMTREVMKCIKDVCRDEDPAYFNVPAMIQLLESNLDAMSRNYDNPALGYLFMLNNGRYIQVMALNTHLRTLLGEDWTRKQASKMEQNIKHCLTCSWNKVLHILKLESNESAGPDVDARSMKDKLHLFNLHFEEICSDQSKWVVHDQQLRRVMRKSLRRMLLPVYDNFLGRFRDVVGSHADQCIKYATSDIQYRLRRLYQLPNDKRSALKNFFAGLRDTVGRQADQGIKYGTSDIKDQLGHLWLPEE